MNQVFDKRFRRTLSEILRRAPRQRSSQQHLVRSRRRTRSESGTFSGHRPYSPGDDLRNLDWNVYARSDELHLKVLEDEDRVGMTLILDRSASMRADDRWTGALRLAAVLGGLALVRLGGLHLARGGGRDPVLQGAASLNRFLDLLEELSVEDSKPAALAGQILDRGSIGRVCWVSDFARPAEFESALALLRRHGGRCTGWLPVLATDRLPDADGYVLFADPETGQEELIQVDSQLRGAMEAELRLLARQQDAVFGEVAFHLQRFQVPEDGDYRIPAWSGGGMVYWA